MLCIQDMLKETKLYWEAMRWQGNNRNNNKKKWVLPNNYVLINANTDGKDSHQNLECFQVM